MAGTGEWVLDFGGSRLIKGGKVEGQRSESMWPAGQS